MPVRNILVSYNAAASSRAALGLALGLARRCDAHVTGVLSHGPSRISMALGPWVTPHIIEQIDVAEGEKRREIAAEFAAATEAARSETPERVHYFDLGGDADESLMRAARYYDLVVMGRYESDPQTSHLAPHPDTVAHSGGRPVIVVPPDHEGDWSGGRVVLAWDGGRAASRAMGDAMPLLEDGAEVTVLTIGEAEKPRRGLDVVEHLRRHGVRAERDDVPRRGPVGRTLLDYCAESGAGLLVMGAYEHSKLAEDLLGGVTRRVLAECPAPVLLSH